MKMNILLATLCMSLAPMAALAEGPECLVGISKCRLGRVFAYPDRTYSLNGASPLLWRAEVALGANYKAHRWDVLRETSSSSSHSHGGGQTRSFNPWSGSYHRSSSYGESNHSNHSSRPVAALEITFFVREDYAYASTTKLKEDAKAQALRICEEEREGLMDMYPACPPRQHGTEENL